MKKRVTLLLALLLCLSMAACAGGEQTPAPAAAPETPAVSAAPEKPEEPETPAASAEPEKPEEPETPEVPAAPALDDGTYSARFDTDSSMFHVNEACEGRGILTVKDGQMTIHISLPSKSIVNLFPGMAEDAQKDGAELLEPTVDTVTYEDGTTEDVNSFDVTVPWLDEEFDLALVGTKGKWYDHKVSVSDPVLIEE